MTYKVIAHALQLELQVSAPVERPQLTPRWWRDRSERFRPVPMPPKITEELPQWSVDLLRGDTKTISDLAAALERTHIEQMALRRMMWSDPNVDPLEDIRRGIQYAREASDRTNRARPIRYELHDVTHVAITARGLELGGHLRSPRRALIQLPICALCRAPVAELVTYYDRERRTYVYAAWCHGREDRVEVPLRQLERAERGTVRVWGQVIF